MCRPIGSMARSYQVRSKRSMSIRAVAWLIVSAVVVVAAVSGFFVVRRGFSARDEPSAVEAVTARMVRRLAVPARSKRLANPVYPSDEVFADARAHFADHCAVCHANDGSG